MTDVILEEKINFENVECKNGKSSVELNTINIHKLDIEYKINENGNWIKIKSREII